MKQRRKHRAFVSFCVRGRSTDFSYRYIDPFLVPPKFLQNSSATKFLGDDCLFLVARAVTAAPDKTPIFLHVRRQTAAEERLVY